MNIIPTLIRCKTMLFDYVYNQLPCMCVSYTSEWRKWFSKQQIQHQFAKRLYHAKGPSLIWSSSELKNTFWHVFDDHKETGCSQRLPMIAAITGSGFYHITEVLSAAQAGGSGLTEASLCCNRVKTVWHRNSSVYVWYYLWDMLHLTLYTAC